MRVFVSYAREDKEEAEAIAYSIRDRGHEVFFDTDSLPAADSYESKIQKAVERSDVFVFLISPQSVKVGRFTLTEMGMARKKWPRPAGRVLPVLIAETPYETIPAYLKAVHILTPEGNKAADTALRVQAMVQPPWRRPRPVIVAAAVMALAVIVGASVAFLSSSFPVIKATGPGPGPVPKSGQEGGGPAGSQVGGAASGFAGAPTTIECSKIGTINYESPRIRAVGMARVIVTGFEDAGFGVCQQAAALANAIAESGLNQRAQGSSGREFGLFQFTTALGTPVELTTASYSIQVAVKEANAAPGFKTAATLRDAVASFVRNVVRPRDPDGETVKRYQIAYELLK